MRRFKLVIIFPAILVCFSSLSWGGELGLIDLLKEQGKFDSIPLEERDEIQEMDAREAKLMALGVHSLAYAMLTEGKAEEVKMMNFIQNIEKELQSLKEDKKENRPLDLDLVRSKIENLELVCFSWALTRNDYAQARHWTARHRIFFGLETLSSDNVRSEP